MTNPNQQPEEEPVVTAWLVFDNGALHIEFKPECDHENIYTGDGKLICWKCGMESELAS